MIGPRSFARIALMASAACLLSSLAAGQAPTPRGSSAAAAARPTTPQRPADAAEMDARRAAAARLLAASRFRERQAVTIQEGIRAAEQEMTGACLQRAIDGRNMQTCRAIATPSEAMRARLAASESAILDEVIAASQSIYARRFSASEMDEITRFFKTPVGQHYGALFPQIIADVQDRKRGILRRYLTMAAAETADHKASR